MIRLKTHIWASGLLRRVQAGGASAFIVRKGDPDAGSVLVKVSTLDGRSTLFIPAPAADMSRAWRCVGPDSDADIDAQIKRQSDYDPDIWVIEIEDKAGRHFLTESIVDAPQR